MDESCHKKLHDIILAYKSTRMVLLVNWWVIAPSASKVWQKI